jgi:catechol 2,3-dioxygenase-like lactoylglutathione lyase family enzyme
VIPGARLVAFVATTDLSRATEFYVERLGLEVVEQTDFGLVVEGGGTQLRVTPVESKADAPYTVLGWSVDDIAAAIDDLVARGVAFRRYDGMQQDDRGVWLAPDGTSVAWFADPDGNTLSLQQDPS